MICGVEREALFVIGIYSVVVRHGARPPPLAGRITPVGEGLRDDLTACIRNSPPCVARTGDERIVNVHKMVVTRRRRRRRFAEIWIDPYVCAVFFRRA